MKTVKQYFQEFYNEIRYQIQRGEKANFTRSNEIWGEYEAEHGADPKDTRLICTYCGGVIIEGIPSYCSKCMRVARLYNI